MRRSAGLQGDWPVIRIRPEVWRLRADLAAGFRTSVKAGRRRRQRSRAL